MDQALTTQCAAYVEASSQEAALKDQLKDVATRRKKAEEDIKIYMTQKKLEELQLPNSDTKIVLREKVANKQPKRDAIVAHLATRLGVHVDRITTAIDELKQTESKKTMKATKSLPQRSSA